MQIFHLTDAKRYRKILKMVEMLKQRGDYCRFVGGCESCPMDTISNNCSFDRTRLRQERATESFFPLISYGKTWKMVIGINPNFIEYVKKEMLLFCHLNLNDLVKAKTGKVIYKFETIENGKAKCIPIGNFKSDKPVLIQIERLNKIKLQIGDTVRNGNGKALYEIIDFKKNGVRTKMFQNSTGGRDCYSSYFNINYDRANKVES